MSSPQYQAQVVLYKGCPFDATYQHSLSGVPVMVKKSWLDSNVSHTNPIINLQHVRIDTATGHMSVRLTIAKADAGTYNYIALLPERKDALDDWVFAFVNTMIYINDGPGNGTAVYDVDCEIDYMMTYFGEKVKWHKCSVDRMHPDKDREKRNFWPENFPIGPYVYTDWKESTNYNDTFSCVFYVENDDKPRPAYIGNIISGVNMRVFNHNAADVFNWAYSLQSAEQIIMMVEIPKAFFGEGFDPTSGGTEYSDWQSSLNEEWEIYPAGSTEIFKHGSNTVHKWTKMGRYPYSFERIYNDKGDYVDLKFEEWGQSVSGDSTGLPNANAKKMKLMGSINPPVSVLATPAGYMNNDTARLSAWRSLELNDFPLGNWVNDAYQTYLGTTLSGRATTFIKGCFGSIGEQYKQHPVMMGVGTAVVAGEIGLTAVGAGAIGLGSTAVGSALKSAGKQAGGKMISSGINLIKDNMQAKLDLDSLGGTVTNANITFTNNFKRFSATHVCLNFTDATHLDDFFSRYGYSYGGSVVSPAVNGKRYGYIKTNGDCCHAVNADDTAVQVITKVLNNGVTLWKTDTTTMANIFTYDAENTFG